MKKLERSEYERLIKGATVVASDHFGDKVLELSDGSYAKLFRLKRLFSSAVLNPYAKRFQYCSIKLEKMGIPTVKVVSVFRINDIKRDLVLYRPLDGTTLREALKDSEKAGSLLDRFARFIAELHMKGIYFRAIHFGNVIVTPEGEMGLIDVSEVRFFPFALGMFKRRRNFSHFFRYEDDKAVISGSSFERFLNVYLENAGLSPKQRESFLKKIGKDLGM